MTTEKTDEKVKAELDRLLAETMDVKYIDHIQGSNCADWRCNKCGEEWVSPSKLPCPACSARVGLHRYFPDLIKENLTLRHSLGRARAEGEGKVTVDRALLERLIREAPEAMEARLSAYLSAPMSGHCWGYRAKVRGFHRLLGELKKSLDGAPARALNGKEE